MSSKSKIISKLTGCARCGETHVHLTFKPFTHPPKQTKVISADNPVYTHFCMCPTMQEPILMWEEEDGK